VSRGPLDGLFINLSRLFGLCAKTDGRNCRQAAGENVRMIKSPLEAATTTTTTTTTNCWQLGRSTGRQSGRKVSQRFVCVESV